MMIVTIRKVCIINIFAACTPSKFWYLGKQGGRYPADTILQRMLDISDTSVSYIDTNLEFNMKLLLLITSFKQTSFVMSMKGEQLYVDRT